MRILSQSKHRRRGSMAMRRLLLIAAIGVPVAVLAPIDSAHAWTYRVIHSFCAKPNCTDGATPYGDTRLLVDPSGNLYGTAARGGSSDAGVLFRLKPDTNTGRWKYQTLYSFCSKADCGDGAYPEGALIADVHGNLYGMATSGGNFGGDGGTAFELMPGPHGRWTLKTLHKFCTKPRCTDGFYPEGGLTYPGAQSGAPYDGSSPLYGATVFGGTSDQGTVFALAPVEGRSKWSHRTIHNFCTETETCDLTDGNEPAGRLVMDADGNLFGATVFGGMNFDGTLFVLSPRHENRWKESVLYAFCAESGCVDGTAPNGVVLDAAGNLFGSTQAGGSNNGGAVFKFSPAQSQLSVLYSFCSKTDCADGHQPFSNLTLDAAGNLFGTTVSGGGNDIDENHDGGGVVFTVTADGAFSVLHRFCAKADCTDGEYPVAGITVDGSGRLFGTAYAGGEHGKGVVFELTP
jgi:uncharacterized repeat protein (TIGR03803 family)